jgi:hypothetical protein
VRPRGEEIKRKYFSTLFPLAGELRPEEEIYWKYVSTPAVSISPAPADLQKSLGFILRGPDSDVDGIDDGDAGGESVEVGAADEIGYEGVDGQRAQ